jgi:GNAT superfamily N-acetyltransferase
MAEAPGDAVALKVLLDASPLPQPAATKSKSPRNAVNVDLIMDSKGDSRRSVPPCHDLAVLRGAQPNDLPFLREMLFEASYLEGSPRPEFEEGLSDPKLAIYLQDWGRSGDHGLIAEDEEGKPAGATWFRLFTADRPGWGYIDDQTPELAIAVVPGRRGQGIGSQLLKSLIELAREQGHSGLSLAADPINHGAMRLYHRLGFREVRRDDEAVVMVLDLAR